MKDQLARLRSVTGGERQPLSTILREVVARMPEDMWLTRIGANDPLDREKGRQEISLNGRVRGASGPEEQGKVREFKEILLRTPRIEAQFDVQMTLKGRPIAPEQAGLNAEMLARTLDDRTEFTIDLKEKR
jgi:hypothetical protein